MDVYRYVTSAGRMTSARNVRIATSGYPEMLEIWWNDLHVIFWLLFAIHFHLTVSIRRCTTFVVDPDGLSGPNEGQCPIWKEMFVQIKEYTFPRTWQVVHVGTSPERQVAVVTKLRTVVPNFFASCQPPGALHFGVAAMFVEDFSTPDLSCN